MSLALCFITSVLIKAYITLINHLTIIKLPEELSVIKLSETDRLAYPELYRRQIMGLLPQEGKRGRIAAVPEFRIIPVFSVLEVV